MAVQYTKEFKEDAVKYYLGHKDLGVIACAKNLGISKSALTNWKKDALAILKKAIGILGN